jgi:hypothetical protein
MNPRIAALLEVVSGAATEQLRWTLAATRVKELDGDYELRQIGVTPPAPRSGTGYELHLYPAISELEVVPGCRPLQYTFVVFRPTGDLLRRREEEERTRASEAPNQAHLEVCRDLAPQAPAMTGIVEMLCDELQGFWPQRKFKFLVAGTSGDIELCFVFVDTESFKQLAVDAGRRAAA